MVHEIWCVYARVRVRVRACAHARTRVHAFKLTVSLTHLFVILVPLSLLPKQVTGTVSYHVSLTSILLPILLLFVQFRF
jgi:hypothetical protein